MGYGDVFGGNVIAPSQVGYTLLSISVNTVMQWPVEQQIAGGNVAAPIVDVNASVGSLSITCPDATLVSPGSSITWNNIGANAVTIKDVAGGTILTLAPGQAWLTYIASNVTVAGTWRIFQLGAGTSTVIAASLAGFGIQAIGTTLNQNMSVTPQSISYTVLSTDQAKLLVWTGGSGTFTLPNPASVGSSWFTVIKNLGSGTLTLSPASGLIDAAATKVLNALDSTFIGCDGTQYFTVGFGRAVASTFNFISINVGGSANYTLSGGQLNQVAYRFTGALTGNVQIIVPASIQQYWMDNETTGAFTLSIGTSGQVTPPTIPQGNRNIFYCDGSNVYAAVTGTVVYPVLPVNGGTGLITIAAGSLLYGSALNTISQLTGIIDPVTLKWTIPAAVSEPTFTIGGTLKMVDSYTSVDPRWYGADPTGVADSTAAFNSAAAASLYVWMAPGTYKITGNVNCGTRNVCFVGASRGSVILNLSNSASAFTWTNAGVTGSGVRHAIIDVTGMTGGFALSFKGQNRLLIDDLTIRGSNTAAGAIYLEDLSSISLHAVWGNGNYGTNGAFIKAVGTTATSFNVLDMDHVQYGGGTAASSTSSDFLVLEGGVNTIDIRHCGAVACRYGVITTNPAALATFAEFITSYDLQFDGLYGTAIILGTLAGTGSTSTHRFTDTYIHNSGANNAGVTAVDGHGVYIYPNCRDVQAQGGIIVTCKLNAVYNDGNAVHWSDYKMSKNSQNTVGMFPGFQLGPSSYECNIHDNNIGQNTGASTSDMSYGVQLDVGTKRNMIVNNTLFNNTLGAINDLALDPNTIIDNNLYAGHTPFHTAISPAAMAATVNNYNPTNWNVNIVKASLTPAGGGTTITGLFTGSSATTWFSGAMVLIENASSTDNITLAHLSGSSNAWNQFSLPGGINAIIGPLTARLFTYNGSKWTPIGGAIILPALTVAGFAYTPTTSIAFSATPTVDASKGNVFEIGALTANVTSLTITNPKGGQSITVRAKQDGTGGRTFANPAGSKIVGALSPTALTASLLNITYSAADTRWEGAWLQLPT